MDQSRYRRVMVLLSALLIVGVFLALGQGRYTGSTGLWTFLGDLVRGHPTDPAMHTVVFRIRLPRIMASVMIGAMLSLSGAVYQGVFRNPLVSPDLLGVSSGATVGAAVSILLGLSMLQRQLFAFAGGLLAVLLVTTIPKLFRNRSNLMLVLSGIIVGGFLNATLALIKFVAEEQTELASIVYWQMGSFSRVLPGEVRAIAPILLIGATTLVLLAWRINILSFGEREARSLGMQVSTIRRVVIACASLLTASAVSISGTIGWIGLVIPHLCRLTVGPDHTKVLPMSLLMGSVFMLGIDTLARVMTSVEIPLSILTGFIGAPLFAGLLLWQRLKIE